MTTTSRTHPPLADAAATLRTSSGPKRRRDPARQPLLLFLGFMLVGGGLLTWVHLATVQQLAVQQLEQRAAALAGAVGASVSPPLLLRNYLAVNLAAEQHARLPEVAYVAVVNERSALVAGLMGHPERLPPDLAARIATEGFPQELLAAPGPSNEEAAGSRRRNLSGIAVQEAFAPIPDAKGAALVGLFASPLDQARRRALWLLWGTLGALTLAGAAVCLFLGRRWRRCLDGLTLAAERLQRRDLATPVPVADLSAASRLAEALEGLRTALRSAAVRRSGP